METTTSREQFNRQAVHYNRQWNQWNEENLRWMIERARQAPVGRVLDVATGSGFTALAFAGMASSVVGIDVSTGMLAQARVNATGVPNVTFQEAAAEAMPFEEGSFDVVTCRIAAHHFQSVSRFLAEARRVLTAAGRLIVADTSVPDGDAELDRWQNEVELLRDPSHVRNYSPGEWRSFAEEAGFVVEELTDQDGSVPITFADWLKKSGCEGERAVRVRALFENAPASAREAYDIRTLPGGDVSFAWKRILLLARV